MVYNLAEILKRDLWTTEDINLSSELTRLFESGIIVKDEQLSKMVNNADGGTIFEVPFIQENPYAEPNISDDSLNLAVPDSISKGRRFAILSALNKSWSSYDIARQLDSGKDAFEAMQDFIGRYWVMDIQHRMASNAVGVLASNVANDGGDLLNDQGGNPFTYDMIIDTNQLRGDWGATQGHDFMVMHSSAYSAIKKSDATRVRAVINNNGVLLYNLYDEKSIIIVDDIMPFDGTNATIMTANKGAFVFAENEDVINPLMFERDELIGNGGGKELVISRKAYLIAINGFSFTGATLASTTGATLAELSDATNHKRVLVDAKQSPVSFLTFAV